MTLTRTTLLVALSFALAGTMMGQNAATKHPISSSHVVHQKPQHHSSGAAKVAVPDDSKRMNAELAKLESQTGKGKRTVHQTPNKVALPSTKSLTQQDHRNSPGINFQYKPPKTAGTHAGVSNSRSPSTNMSGPRMR